MKRISCVFIILYVLSLNASSHPGRTDANGGHWYHSTGEYHFHTGEYVGKSSSGSSSNSEYEPFTPPYEPPTENPYRADLSEPNNVDEDKPSTISHIIGICLLVLFFVVSPFVCMCTVIYENLLYRILPEYKLSEFSSAIEKLKRDLESLKDLEEEIIIYSANCSPPDNIEIGEDNLPKEKGSAGWGETFIGYISPHGKKAHAKLGCGNSSKRVHLYYYRNSLCQNCCRNITLPDFSWYDSHLKVKRTVNMIDYTKSQIVFLEKKLDKYFKRCNSKALGFLLLFNKKNRDKLNSLNEQYNIIKNR